MVVRCRSRCFKAGALSDLRSARVFTKARVNILTSLRHLNKASVFVSAPNSSTITAWLLMSPLQVGSSA